MNINIDNIITDQSYYLIKIDNEPFTVCESNETTQEVVNSIVSKKIEEINDDWTNVFRREVNKGKTVIISTQRLGRVVNGYLTDYIRIDIENISLMYKNTEKCKDVNTKYVNNNYTYINTQEYGTVNISNSKEDVLSSSVDIDDVTKHITPESFVNNVYTKEFFDVISERRKRIEDYEYKNFD